MEKFDLKAAYRNVPVHPDASGYWECNGRAKCM